MSSVEHWRVVRRDTGEQLLRDMIGAVLELPTPIREMDILNLEISEDAPGDKSIVLDVAASGLALPSAATCPPSAMPSTAGAST